MKKLMMTSMLMATLAMPTAVKAEEFAHPAQVSYYYFSCNPAGIVLNEDTLLRCLDKDCISMGLEYEVSAPRSQSVFDTCNLVQTATPNTWDETSKTIGAYVESPVRAPVVGVITDSSSARFYGNGPIKVSYPAPGKYQIIISRARAAFSISKVAK